MEEEGRLVSGKGTQLSIIIPTYNESQNILKILKSIGDILPKNILVEAIVVDDNSPDGTGKIVENYLKEFKKITGYTIDIIHRTAKKGLSSAILNGIQQASGDTIVVMDSDFGLCFCPERIDPLNKEWKLENIPRIIYCSDDFSFEISKIIYQYINNSQLTRVTPTTKINKNIKTLIKKSSGSTACYSI